MTSQLKNFCFVVDGRIAGSAMPEGSASEVVEALKQHNIKTLVTLTEQPHPAAAELRQASITPLHLPIEDYTAPSDEQMNAVALLVANDAACPILIHCRAGIGRTGTMLAVALAALRGGNSDEVIATIRGLRPGSLEVPEQEEAFRKWNERQRSTVEKQGV